MDQIVGQVVSKSTNYTYEVKYDAKGHRVLIKRIGTIGWIDANYESVDEKDAYDIGKAFIKKFPERF